MQNGFHAHFWRICRHKLWRLLFAFALVVSVGVLGVSSRIVSAADVVTDVLGTPGNATVALTWTAPDSNLPLNFGATSDAVLR